MDVFSFLEKGLFFAFAALGFAFLFNVPRRALVGVMSLACIGGCLKLFLMHWDIGIIVASLAGASVIGIFSVQVAHFVHVPHVVCSIPAVIPLVPGVYMYRMMVGCLYLTTDLPNDMYLKTLAETIHSALTAGFIAMALAVGVAVPLLLARQKSGKHLRFFS